MSDSRESGGWFALGVMLGAAVGAAIGLLYAPRPGTDTRREFADRSDELRRRAAQAGAGLGERSGAFVEHVRQSDDEPAESDESVDAATDSVPSADESDTEPAG